MLLEHLKSQKLLDSIATLYCIVSVGSIPYVDARILKDVNLLFDGHMMHSSIRCKLHRGDTDIIIQNEPKLSFM